MFTDLKMIFVLSENITQRFFSLLLNKNLSSHLFWQEKNRTRKKREKKTFVLVLIGLDGHGTYGGL